PTRYDHTSPTRRSSDQEEAMKIVVTGGRDYQDTNMLYDVLSTLKPTKVFVGDCPTGVDRMVSEWCDEHKVSHTIFVANWDEFGKDRKSTRLNSSHLGSS